MATYPLTAQSIAAFGLDYVRNATPAERTEIAERYAADTDDIESRTIAAKIDAIKSEDRMLEMQRAKAKATSKPKPRAKSVPSGWVSGPCARCTRAGYAVCGHFAQERGMPLTEAELNAIEFG